MRRHPALPPRRAALVLLMVGAGLSSALAHGPTPQKIEADVTIAAPPDAVWAVAGRFGDVAAWNPLVASGKSTGTGTKNGDTRTLTLKNGGILHESLDEYDAAQRSYSYRLDDPDLKALPVSSYSATLTVTPDGTGSKVAWFGRFYRGDTGNEPPEELSDAAGRAAMKAYFETGLAGLKAKVEGNGAGTKAGAVR
ncbi:MxaD protein [Methylobacterium indicum]|uniref:MxaD protein n=2 Tax=Methylobacterium indicum TaxID=1775910 RepID=A0ABR5HH11_9HYPH|nr:SRPBCC family protein [Methylobacterium indicum]KMO25872.1 MxaD protein [Methylobacterium indicum]KTS34718.1 MxaD protein [Methylobacterium indicum]